MSVADSSALSTSGSYFSGIASAASSAASTVISAGQAGFNSAINGISFIAGGVCSTVKQGITFSATVCAANPRITKVAIASVALVAAAYAGRSYLPTFGKTVSQ